MGLSERDGKHYGIDTTKAASARRLIFQKVYSYGRISNMKKRLEEKMDYDVNHIIVCENVEGIEDDTGTTKVHVVEPVTTFKFKEFPASRDFVIYIIISFFRSGPYVFRLDIKPPDKDAATFKWNLDVPEMKNQATSRGTLVVNGFEFESPGQYELIAYIDDIYLNTQRIYVYTEGDS